MPVNIMWIVWKAKKVIFRTINNADMSELTDNENGIAMDFITTW